MRGSRSVACAIVHDDPPEVFIAHDEPTLNRVLALRVVAQLPPGRLDPELRLALRDALREERWGDAVERWIAGSAGAAIDIYPTFELHTDADVALTDAELQFSPLFRDDPEGLP